MLAGVCSGLADYFDVDVTWIRIAFVVATMAGFSGVLAYIVLWIAVPARPFVPGAYSQGRRNRYSADYRVYEERAESSAYSTYSVPQPPVPVRKSGNGRMIAGLLLVAFGAFFLLDEFDVVPYWFDFDKLWPLVFIIPGILIISKNGRGPSSNNDMNMRGDYGAPVDTDASANANSSVTDTTTTGTTGIVNSEDEPKL